MSATGARRLATDAVIERGSGLYIPGSGTVPGGEYGATIANVDRTYAITRTPVGHRVVFILAHDIWDKWFELELEEGDDAAKNKDFNDLVQAELKRIGAKPELDRLTIFERAYGWAVLGISYVGTPNHAEPYMPVAKEGEAGFQDITDLRAYGGDNISSVLEDKDNQSDRFGFPKEYRIVQAGQSHRLRLHYTRAIHAATRLLDHDWKGKSVLDALWDDLVTLQNIRWSLGQTLYRYGSGFPDLTFQNVEREKIQAWIDAGGFTGIFTKAYFAHNENQSLEFKGVGGVALDPMNYYLPIMESISLATSIPLAILRGAQAGALTGSEVNEREYQGLISDEQVAYEEVVRALILAVLRQPKIKDKAASYFTEGALVKFKIKWLSGIELSEVEKVDLELKNAQLLQIKGGWHTRNELRKMEDPKAKDLPEDQGGDEILGRSPMMKGPPPGAEQFHVEEHSDGTRTVTEIPRRRPSSKKR